MRLIDHPEARAEMLEATRFYRRGGPVPAKRFLDEVAQAIVVIKERPERWRLLSTGVRCCRLPRFPYSILYRVKADHLVVFAYKHDSRHPDYWLDRLTD